MGGIKRLVIKNELNMNKIFFIGILIFGCQIVFSQQISELTDSIINMEKQDILGLRTTIYKVGDLNIAKEWYAKAFEIEPYFDEPFYVGYNIRGYELGLLPEENPTTEKPESVLTYWGVNEIEKVYNHFIKSGATESEKPHSVGEPLMVAAVKDPWGNVIGFIYNPVFKLEE